ncbi:hypothetical protein JTB14_018589 [Gonioctena quinquepunctata]|nr:hypothetical protein JTB14_018589 [Gonioctena quinquepunctata]
MGYKTVVILLICLTLSQWSTQESRVGRHSGTYSGGGVQKNGEPSNWKAVLIIIVSVLFFCVILYGTNCFYICKMHFFEQTEKKYRKMDSCTNV